MTKLEYCGYVYYICLKSDSVQKSNPKQKIELLQQFKLYHIARN